MTQRTQTILAYSVATALFVCSGYLWTTVLLRHPPQWGAQPPEAKNRPLNVQDQLMVPASSEQPPLQIHASLGGETRTTATDKELLPERFASPEGQQHAAPAESDELLQWGIAQRNSLAIPSIALSVPVFQPDRTFWDRHDWATLEEQMQIGLLHGATAYPHSVLPGEQGVLIIAGHSSPPDHRAQGSAFGRIFERLTELRKGESVLVTDDEETFRYRVTDTMIVDAGSTDILRQEKDRSLLKLITCYPVGSDAKRFIVIAEKI